jgi:hypothetical protein
LGPPLAGGAALLAATGLLSLAFPVTFPGTTLATRVAPLLLHLAVGAAAYLAGYVLTSPGRDDLVQLSAKLRRR